VEIEALECRANAQTDLIVGKPLDDFRALWSEWRKDEAVNQELLTLSNWTFDKEAKVIVPKPPNWDKLQVSERNCEVTRGLVFEVVETTYGPPATTVKDKGYMLMINSPFTGQGTSWPCEIVQRHLSTESQEVTAKARNDRDLFNVQCLETSTYLPLNAKYLIVNFVFPVDADIALQFDYEDMVPGYELICIVHREGNDTECGHYTTSLKFDGRWHAYDDAPLTRKRITEPNATAPPYLMLFRRESMGRRLATPFVRRPTLESMD
jgi:hypothetical protein